MSKDHSQYLLQLQLRFVIASPSGYYFMTVLSSCLLLSLVAPPPIILFSVRCIARLCLFSLHFQREQWSLSSYSCSGSRPSNADQRLSLELARGQAWKRRRYSDMTLVQIVTTRTGLTLELLPSCSIVPFPASRILFPTS